jgi:chromosomal replication initiation ATPase DnaA
MIGPIASAIIAACASEFDVTQTAMLGKSGGKSVMFAWRCAWLLLDELHKSSVEIGKITNRNHSSVLHGLREVRYWLKNDPSSAEALARIRARIAVGEQPQARAAE